VVIDGHFDDGENSLIFLIYEYINLPLLAPSPPESFRGSLEGELEGVKV